MKYFVASHEDRRLDATTRRTLPGSFVDLSDGVTHYELTILTAENSSSSTAASRFHCPIGTVSRPACTPAPCAPRLNSPAGWEPWDRHGKHTLS